MNSEKLTLALLCIVQSQIRQPIVMWLSGLHSPKSYLTSLLQLACRKYGWLIERSEFYTSVTRWTCESEVQREPDVVSMRYIKTTIKNPPTYNLPNLAWVQYFNSVVIYMPCKLIFLKNICK